MDIPPPPPPPPLPYLIGVTPTTTTSPPQVINNGGIAANIPQIPQHHHHHTSSHSPSGSSIIIVMIVISSAIIVSAIIYLLIRFLSRRCNRSFRTTVVLNNQNQNDTDNENGNVRQHVICVENSGATESLPLFRFSSLTGKIAGGDCAVCLSKFEGEDQLRLLPLCCHAFHAECIDAWLKSNQTCPLCRSAVNPSEADVLKRLSSSAAASAGGTAAGRFGGNRSGSFRIEIGNVSQRREAASDLSDGRSLRSYSIGSYEYVLDEGGYEVPVESTHHRRGGSECTSVDKDSTAAAAPEPPGNNVAAEVGGGSGRRNWLRDYVDRFSVSRSSRSQSFRGGSGRFFGGSLRRSETVEDYEAAHGRIGEEISELFRWFSGV